MRVRHAFPFVLLLAVLLPAAASGAACPPLQCGPEATTVAGGQTLAVDVGNSTYLYNLSTGKQRALLSQAVLAPDGRRAVAQIDRTLLTYDLATGRVVSRTRIPDGWTLAGASRDAARTVLFATPGSSTRVAIRSSAGQETLVLPGKFDFDGLLGSKLYLIQYAQTGYLVRVADLATGKLLPDPLKDADEPALILGQAWSRVASPDGRYLFTVYITGGGTAMIHELDMRDGKAWCIDLPGSGDYNAAGSYAIALSRDGKRLYAAGGAYGTVVTVDVAAHSVAHVSHYTAIKPQNTQSLPSATLSPDGKTLAFSNAGAVRVFDLGSDRVTQKTQLPPDAVLAYAPSGKLVYADKSGGPRPAFA